MRRTCLALFLLLASAVAFAGKPNPADYSVKVHVQSSRLVAINASRDILSPSPRILRLKVLIDGKKLVLECWTNDELVFRTGDYIAKVVKEEKEGIYGYRMVYEFLFPDGTTIKFLVVGESE